ncbi:MAG: hypothetical protein ACUVX9_09215 [Anaerolineae bacterium]
MVEPNARTPRIALVVGGCFKVVAQHPAIVDAHRVVYIDAYSETDDVPSTPEVIPIDLARDETVRSLCARFDGAGDLHPLRRQFPAHLDRIIRVMGCKSVDLAKGLGQVPAVAYLAWRARLEQGLAATFRAMIDDLTVRAGGQLARIEIDVFHSNAGATGRGIANAVVEKICELFQGRTVSVTHYVVGRMSFTGLGSHVHDNAPLGVLEDIAFQREPPTQAKTVHRWLGVELPPVGNDVTLRTQLSALWAQAITAPRTRELLDRPQANRSAADVWGNFTLTRSGWHRSSMAEDDVVAGAAQHVLHELDRLLAKGAAPQAPWRVEFALPPQAPAELVQGFPADLHKASLEALQGVIAADALMGLVRQGAPAAQPTVCLRRPSGEAVQATSVLRAVPSSDYVQLVAALQELRAVREALAEAINEETQLVAEQGELDRQLKRAQRSLTRATAALCPRTLEEHLRALWHPAAKRRLAFLHAAVAYRHAAAAMAEHEARLAVLQNLRDRADEVSRATQEPFQAMRGALEHLLAKLPPPADSRAVRYRSLEQVLHERQTAFEVLLRAARTGSDERLYRVLRQMARGITLEGLAAILKLPPTADALAIVNKLDRDADEMGPFWGGMPRPDAEIDQRIRVLPPLEDEVLRALQHARDAIGSNVQIVCAQSMAGGIGVVALDTYLVKQWLDLLSPEYQQDLEATLANADALALAHVPGSRLYLDGVLDALHVNPSAEIRQLLFGPSAPLVRHPTAYPETP